MTIREIADFDARKYGLTIKEYPSYMEDECTKDFVSIVFYQSGNVAAWYDIVPMKKLFWVAHYAYPDDGIDAIVIHRKCWCGEYHAGATDLKYYIPHQFCTFEAKLSEMESQLELQSRNECFEIRNHFYEMMDNEMKKLGVSE